MHSVEGSGLARFMREALYAYPLAEATHIVGLALLFGGIALVDLRLLGLGRRLPVKPLLALAVPWAVGGFFLAAFTGILMFTAHAGEFLTQPVFLVKMGLILAAGSNAAMLHAGPLTTQTLEAGALPPPRVRLAAGLSLALWIGVIFCGRLLAYL